MKKSKRFDAVRLMREIRDRMSQEMRGMTPREQIEYIRKKSGTRRRKSQITSAFGKR